MVTACAILAEGESGGLATEKGQVPSRDRIISAAWRWNRRLAFLINTGSPTTSAQNTACLGRKELCACRSGTAH